MPVNTRSLDPRSKLALWVSLMVASLLCHAGWYLAIYLLLAAPAVMVVTGCVRAALSFTAKLVLPTAVMLVVVYGFLVPTANNDSYQLADISVSMRGIGIALAITARLFMIGVATIGFSAAVPLTQLASGLRALGMPAPIVAIFISSFNIHSLMLQKLRQIADAQRSRGLQPRGLIWGRVRVYLPMLQPLLFGMLQGAVERSSLWHSRGYLRHFGYYKLALGCRDGAALLLAGGIVGSAVCSRWIPW